MLAMVVVAAGCADSPRTVVTSKAPDTRQFVNTLFPVWVEVCGSPFDGEPSAIAAAVATAMTEAYVWNPSARFTSDRGEAAVRTTKIVVTFNGAAGIGGRNQCEGQSEGGGPLPRGRIEAVATLCSSGGAMANVRGVLPASDGIDDRRFSALIRQLTRDMFRRDPDGGRSGLMISGGGLTIGF